jgi:hypothetical protein
MKIKVTEVRVYDIPGVLEPDIRGAIRRGAVAELDEFLCDLSDMGDFVVSTKVVAVEEVKKGRVKRCVGR